MIDPTRQIVFSGRVVSFAGPADEARDAHGRWAAAIASLPDREYNHSQIRAAAGLTPTEDLGFKQATSYVQGKIDQNKRYLASMANWRPEERDPEEMKQIDTHNAILQGAMDHGVASRVAQGEKPQWQMPYMEWVGKHGTEHATKLAQTHAKPGTSIQKAYGHEWTVTTADGKSESGTRTLGKSFRDPFAAAKASWEYEPDANGEAWYKTGKAPRGLPGKMKKSAESIPAIHRELVEQAFKEGKPVPAEVLERYPHLTSGGK